MALTPEDQKYYDGMGDMFGSVGWKQLTEDLQKEIYQIQADALEADSWDAVLKLRGRAEAWAYLLNFEAIVDFQKEQAELPEAEEDYDGSPSI